MPSLEQLHRKIQSADSLSSVVTTMKTLAAVNVRQFEVMVEALGEYDRTVQLGLQVVLRAQPGLSLRRHGETDSRLAVIVIGSDQGMCGPFSKRIVEFALEKLDQMPYSHHATSIMAVGARVVSEFEEAERSVADYIQAPASVDGVSNAVQDVATCIDTWELRPGTDNIIMFHNRMVDGHGYEPQMVKLSPMSTSWLNELRERPWDSRSLPMFTLDAAELLSRLLRQYIMVSIWRGMAQSAASENQSRLQAMQAAEGNIDDLLRELNTAFQLERQNAITEEVLDIVSGFEALTNE